MILPDAMGFMSEIWDTWYGRNDALRGGLAPEEYAAFMELEARLRAAVTIGQQLRREEVAEQRRLEYEAQRQQAKEHAERTAHLRCCWPGLTEARGIPRCAGVYIVHHMPSGREYVGQSTKIGVRWSQHLSELRAGQSFRGMQGDWTADGPHTFAWEIVEVIGEPEGPERLAPDELRISLLFAERRWIADRQPVYNRN
jgi:hypothetical protein